VVKISIETAIRAKQGHQLNLRKLLVFAGAQKNVFDLAANLKLLLVITPMR
jgi:hypothetical protein